MAWSTNCQYPGPTNSIHSQPLPAAFRNKLKILKWNANGIRPKFVETHDRDRIDMIFEKLHSFEEAGVEILPILLNTTKSTWFEIYNVYLPNIST